MYFFDAADTHFNTWHQKAMWMMDDGPVRHHLRLGIVGVGLLIIAPRLTKAASAQLSHLATTLLGDSTVTKKVYWSIHIALFLRSIFTVYAF